MLVFWYLESMFLMSWLNCLSFWLHQDLQMTVQEMNLYTENSVHCSKTVEQGLNEVFIIWWLPIFKEISTTASKAFHASFSTPGMVSKNCSFCNSQQIYGSSSTSALIFLQDKAKIFPLKQLKRSTSWFKTFTNCFLSPILICNGSKTFLGLTSGLFNT